MVASSTTIVTSLWIPCVVHVLKFTTLFIVHCRIFKANCYIYSSLTIQWMHNIWSWLYKSLTRMPSKSLYTLASSASFQCCILQKSLKSPHALVHTFIQQIQISSNFPHPDELLLSSRTRRQPNPAHSWPLLQSAGKTKAHSCMQAQCCAPRIFEEAAGQTSVVLGSAS